MVGATLAAPSAEPRPLGGPLGRAWLKLSSRSQQACLFPYNIWGLPPPSGLARHQSRLSPAGCQCYCRHQPGSLTRTWEGFRERAHRAWTGSLGQCVQGPGGAEAEGTWAGREVLVPCMCVCVCVCVSVCKYVSVNEHVCKSGFISMCLFVHVSVCV